MFVPETLFSLVQSFLDVCRDLLDVRSSVLPCCVTDGALYCILQRWLRSHVGLLQGEKAHLVQRIMFFMLVADSMPLAKISVFPTISSVGTDCAV